MTRSLLPLDKSGWVYMLLLLWATLYWVEDAGGFRQINQWNREQLFKLLPNQMTESTVVRLASPLTSKQLPALTKLFAQYPKTPVVLLGQPSQELLKQLPTYVDQQARQASVFVATEQIASVAQLRRLDDSDWLTWLDRLRLRELEVQWRTSEQLIFAPFVSDEDGGIALLWGEQNRRYPSLPGQLFMQSQQAQTGITGSWNLSIEGAATVWPVGYNTVLYSAGPVPSTRPLSQFLSSKKQQATDLIIIDDQTHPMGDEFARLTSRFLDHHYLYQGLLLWISPFGLIASGLLLLWWTRSWPISRQAGVILSMLVALWALQYIAFSQRQWLAAMPISLTLVFSWLISLGFQRELKIIEALNAKHNYLLGEAVGIFYQAHKIERLETLLSDTRPDLKLAEKVFDVALQAEAKNNRPLAKKLLSWIQQSGLKHQGASQRLADMAEREQSAGLDSTMVIEPGQNQSQSFSGSFLQPESFGRYQVEGILGKGAMGIVYQGVDPKINRHVAIKTLQLNDSDDNDRMSETKARFFREAETAGNLSHANIVTIYDVGDEGELGYIAMDLLTGAPLSAFVKPQNRLPAPLIYQLMIQITDALDYAHRQNVVHRDIKPGNIIFDDEIQRVTITDFGIAFVADNSKTRTGTIMGSPYYMSPEQVLGKRVDGRSDIFSLGVTFYQLLSGHLPFDGESIASVAYHITNSKQTSVRHWDDRLPASAARLTNKALQKEASKRFQSMDEFKQALIAGLKRDFKKAPIV